jgi:hypothetical protein
MAALRRHLRNKFEATRHAGQDLLRFIESGLVDDRRTPGQLDWPWLISPRYIRS